MGCPAPTRSLPGGKGSPLNFFLLTHWHRRQLAFRAGRHLPGHFSHQAAAEHVPCPGTPHQGCNASCSREIIPGHCGPQPPPTTVACLCPLVGGWPVQQSRAQTLELGGPGSDLAVEFLGVSRTSPTPGPQKKLLPPLLVLPIPSQDPKQGSSCLPAPGPMGSSGLRALPQADDADPTLMALSACSRRALSMLP